jgi:hypothetical protein
MSVIATVSGTAIRPGISKNNRKYTAEVIGKAVELAQARIASGGLPLTTRTHHAAGDDSALITGQVTKMWQEADGSAKYTATIADTRAGRDILGLISGKQPALRGVSIRGAWTTPVQHIQQDGKTIETASGLEFDGLDYTASPGVEGALIERVQPVGAAPAESYRNGRTPVFESAPDNTVTLGADTPTKPLHQMSNQELRDHAATVWAQVAPARQSPAWVHRPPRSLSQYIAADGSD